MALHLVLHEPEIPQNTGNIARTCVATGAHLHLIEPLGFSLSDRYLKRAGLDYWSELKLHTWKSLEEFFAAVPALSGDASSAEGGTGESLADVTRPGTTGDGGSGNTRPESSDSGSCPYPANCYFISTKAQRDHCSIAYPEDAFFLFGRESRGLPEELMNACPHRSLRIPMTEGTRSLNLSNSAAIIAYEYLRQRDFRFTL